MDWDAVEDGWTLPRYIAMQEMWAEEGPPLETWAAAYFKFKGEPPERKRKINRVGAAENIQSLMAEFGGGRG